MPQLKHPKGEFGVYLISDGAINLIVLKFVPQVFPI